MTRKNTAYFVSAAIIILALAFLVLPSAKATDKGAANKSPSVLVKTSPVQIQNIPFELKLIGTVIPHKTVSISSRIDSQIIDVNFSDGDVVRKGDVLFTLDDRTIRADLNQAKADLGRDIAQVEALRRDYDRNVSLIKQDAVSQQALDASKAALEAQIATVEAGRAAVQSNEILLDYTIIKAPIDGHTGIVNVTEGNNVKANDVNPLVVINQTQPIQVQISLPQDSFDQVRNAMAKGDVAVSALRNTPGAKPIEGVLSHIDNNIDQTTGTFIARAIFQNEEDALWPGMLVNLTVNIGTETNVLTIPEVAIQTAPDGKFVFVITNNIAKKTPVKINRIQNGLALISAGLNEGDEVAIDGIMALKDGSATRTANDIEKSKPEKMQP